MRRMESVESLLHNKRTSVRNCSYLINSTIIHSKFTFKNLLVIGNEYLGRRGEYRNMNKETSVKRTRPISLIDTIAYKIGY